MGNVKGMTILSVLRFLQDSRQEKSSKCDRATVAYETDCERCERTVYKYVGETSRRFLLEAKNTFLTTELMLQPNFNLFLKVGTHLSKERKMWNLWCGNTPETNMMVRLEMGDGLQVWAVKHLQQMPPETERQGSLDEEDGKWGMYPAE